MADSSQGSLREDAFAALIRARGIRRPGTSHVDATLRRLATFFAQAALREEIARRPGRLQRVDPRARILAVLVFLVSASLAWSLPALAAHGVLPIAALGLSRIRPREFLGAGFAVALVFAVLIAAPATLNLFVDGTVLVPLVVFERSGHLGPFTLPQVIGVTGEGLLSAATFVLRVLASVAAVLWLTLSTTWMDLLRALRVVGVPALVVEVVGMTVRYLFAFRHMVEETYLGKKSRTVCRAPAGQERAWVASRLGQTWERSLSLMGEVSEAMTARGFTGEIRSPRVARFEVPEWGLLILTVLACAAAHLL